MNKFYKNSANNFSIYKYFSKKLGDKFAEISEKFLKYLENFF